MKELNLKYGCNPHQKPALVRGVFGDLPFRVLNGAPGYINLLDALNSWQLVRGLKSAFKLPAAASFKHVSPAGAALGIELKPELAKACFVDDLELSPLACAYARARGADRMSSFGDWIALSDIVDISTAKIIKREVSDGIIAPGYDPDALELLKAKRDGKYAILEIDPDFQPPAIESREVFGVCFEQLRNDPKIDSSLLEHIVTKRKDLSDQAKRDLVLAMIVLQYTQSNSVCFAIDGQAIGIGAGQQSRVHCTRLAASKADIWRLRQHPEVLGLSFVKGLGRPEKSNAIDLVLRDDITKAELRQLDGMLSGPYRQMDAKTKREWLDSARGVSVASDAFFPFRDNIDRAAASGAEYIAQPGGSVRDEDVIAACDEYGIAMAFNGLRLFHH